MSQVTFDQVVNVLSQPPKGRLPKELEKFSAWFQKRSKLFEKLKLDSLIDLLKHCHYKEYPKNGLIIGQQEKGDSFYIILRGSVSVVIKDLGDDSALIDFSTAINPGPTCNIVIDRSKIGNTVTTFKEGQSFGELALINDDCVRTASIVADTITSVIVIHKDLYNRSVGKIISQEYQEKLSFVENHELFRNWPTKWKKHLAASVNRIQIGYNEVIVRQGDAVNEIFFITNGEAVVQMDPEAHKKQFGEFIRKCQPLMLNDSKDREERDALVKLTRMSPSLWKCTRVQKTINRHNSHMMLPQQEAVLLKASGSRVNVCYVGVGQSIGGEEMALDLPFHHSTVIAMQPLTLLTLERGHYDRLLVRRNPGTLKHLQCILSLQIRRRYSRPALDHHVPLLRYLGYKLQEAAGERNSRIDSRLCSLSPRLQGATSRLKTSMKLSQPMLRDFSKQSGPMPGKNVLSKVIAVDRGVTFKDKAENDYLRDLRRRVLKNIPDLRADHPMPSLRAHTISHWAST